MIIEESTVTSKAVFNQEKTHRTLLTKIWNENLPSAAILMTNPSTADILKIDFTTMYIINNLSALNYGSVSIVNLFSFMTTKLDLKGNLEELTNEENIAQILQLATECDVFIIAMGKITDTHKKVAIYQNKLFEKLRKFQDKIYTIQAYDGTQNLHPLCPKLRYSWKLIPYKLPEPPKASGQNTTKSKSQESDVKQKEAQQKATTKRDPVSKK